MGSLLVTAGSFAAPAVVKIPDPATRIVLTMVGSVADASITTDGSAPVALTSTAAENRQSVLQGVAGSQTLVGVSQPGGHLALPSLRISSAGSPTIRIEW